jgi:hypothetical protein
MATVTPRLVGSLSFSGWQENLRPLLTRGPAVSVSNGPAPNLAPFQRRLHDLPLQPDVFCLHPLGSVSWCTRYGSARKQTYSNQPIFLFLSRMVVGSIEDLPG